MCKKTPHRLGELSGSGEIYGPDSCVALNIKRRSVLKAHIFRQRARLLDREVRGASVSSHTHGPGAEEAHLLQRVQAPLADGQAEAQDGSHEQPHSPQRLLRDRVKHTEGESGIR